MSRKLVGPRGGVAGFLSDGEEISVTESHPRHMTDYEFRAVAQAVFGEDVVTPQFTERLFERLRDANIHLASIHYAAPSQPHRMELRAHVHDAQGTFERRLWITADLGIARMQDIRPPRPQPVEENRRREPPPQWNPD